MKITEYIQNNILFLDGAMGTVLQHIFPQSSLPSEMLNLHSPDSVKEVHKAYLKAGANVISTDSFGINAFKYTDEELEKLITAAIENAKNAVKECKCQQQKYIAYDIGPLGKLLKPLGNISFDEAVESFSKCVRIAEKSGVDLFFIETMNDSHETKAALLAVKENSDLPVFVSNAYGEDGKLMTGATAGAMATLLESLGADAVGANCSFGPEKTLPVIKELSENTRLPIIMKPNAGIPVFKDGKTVYEVTPDSFAKDISEALSLGVNIIGGCCGTSPEFIAELVKQFSDMKPKKRNVEVKTSVSSYTHTVSFGASPVLIGERINPTGKKRFKQALLENDIDYILKEAIAQQEKGVHVLDVNVGLAGIDEAEMLQRAVTEIQAVCDLPLQLDSSDPTALERAMRVYNGKPLVNSVNAKKESMEKIFPLVKKYGGTLIALTLDENGIPEIADGRIKLAKKIINTAQSYGIGKENLIFDPLAMTVSTSKESALVTLECIERITKELGCKTSLGVSNISFGLPTREILNSTFFALALDKGLSAAIMNPFSSKMLDVYYGFNALTALDDGFSAYIGYCDSESGEKAPEKSSDNSDSLTDAVFKGRKESAYTLAKQLLQTTDSLEVINGYIIPALDKTGEAYENKKIYLPQLLMSAEAAARAFDAVKEYKTSESASKCTVVLATVKGDIHDIGKNIVKLLLENYGFNVIDLGKDVSADKICSAVTKHAACVVGLSALMTTTLDAMENAVKAVAAVAPNCKIVVGGAVVNQDFATAIGADKYASDAMETVRFCEMINQQNNFSNGE